MPANHNEVELQIMAAQIKVAHSPGEIAQLVRLISPTPSTGEMSAEEFERVMKVLVAHNKRRPYSAKSITAARLVLVMGATISEAAAEVGLNRQNVSVLMKRIRGHMESLPKGWVKVGEWYPGEVATQLGEISESLKELHAAGKPLDGLTFTITLP